MIINDPVHGFIPAEDSLIIELINSRNFQHLRRIRQLGTTFITYPGAEHTRFLHSLGVYFLGTRIIEHLFNLSSNPFSHLSTEERCHIKRVVQVACLLHDIGHGPFSHLFERITGIPHEDWTRKIILGEEPSEIFHILTRYDSTLPKEVVSLLDKNFLDPHFNIPSCLNWIISSELDADRMDYILRDAYYTGVRSGFINVERIIYTLDVYRENIKGQIKEKIVVWDKSFYNIEEYVFARYYLYWKVYYHKTTRFFDLLMLKIFQRLLEVSNSSDMELASPNLIKVITTSPIRLADWLGVDDNDILISIKSWAKQAKDDILRDLASRFLYRKPFKCIPAEVLEKGSSSIIEKIREAEAYLQNQGVDTRYYFLDDQAHSCPYNFYDEEIGTIYIIDKFSNKPHPLSELSSQIRMLSQRKAARRFYVLPKYFSRVVEIFSR